MANLSAAVVKVLSEIAAKHPDILVEPNMDIDDDDILFILRWINGPTIAQVEEITKEFEKSVGGFFTYRRSYTLAAFAIAAAEAEASGNEEDIDLIMRNRAF